MMPDPENVEGLLVHGERTAAAEGGVLDIHDPSTGEVMARVAKGTARDIDAAVASAREALDADAWARMAPAERGRLLQRIAQAIRDRAEDLARLESRDNGKPLRQARTDVQVAARYFEFYAGVADKIMGHTIPLGHGLLDFTVREPIGVSAQIVPWNYPIQIGSRGIAAALTVGCTVVVKPSEEAPMTALRLGEIALECGLPPGVVNVVPGTGLDAGAPLASHRGVNQITFTGSVAVGIAVAKMAADNVVPVVMELGGKSPNIVFADADLDAAVRETASGAFFNAGQVCSAATRVVVDRTIRDAFVDKLATRAQSLRIGDPRADGVNLGPVISRQQMERVLNYIRIGRDEGAQLVCGGERVGERGYFVQPTVFAGVTGEMRVAREEIFGPVVSVLSFADEEEAVSLANGTDYSLAAAVWTRDIDRAHRMSDRLDAGTVWINTYGPTDARLPWGGMGGQSGIGRDLGRLALDNYTEQKTVWLKRAG
jgi:aldehyde dehydrogenase (NAD+)